jgi:hypothetical protein
MTTPKARPFGLVLAAVLLVSVAPEVLWRVSGSEI